MMKLNTHSAVKPIVVCILLSCRKVVKRRADAYRETVGISSRWNQVVIRDSDWKFIPFISRDNVLFDAFQMSIR